MHLQDSKTKRSITNVLFENREQESPGDEHPGEEQVLGQYIPLLYHYNMLLDQDRVGGFAEAIKLLVRPGMHVVELGGGTGILSSLAARQGAQVTCVERNPDLVRSARQFVRDNGLQEMITVRCDDAANFVPEQPVDVVICEMLHVGLLREKQAQVISAFKRGYMAAYGHTLPVFIPEASILMVQPVEQCFDFAGYWAPVPMFQAALLDQPRTQEISPLSAYASIAYHESIPMHFDVCDRVIANRRGFVNAIRLVTQNVLAIDVNNQHAVTWPNQCLVLPIDDPFDVDVNDSIEMRLNYHAGSTVEELANSMKVTRLSIQSLSELSKS